MFWTNIVIDVLLFVYVIDCLFMGLVIMMQRSKQEGLGAAFGGGMMSDTFGAQTSQVLVKATVWAAILFFILSISLARLYSARANFLDKGSPVQQELLKPVVPIIPVRSNTSSTNVPTPSVTVVPASNFPTPSVPVSQSATSLAVPPSAAKGK